MEIDVLIEDLQKAREGALVAFELAQAQLIRIDQALASLKGEALPIMPAPSRRLDFVGMGPTAAAEKLLEEKGPGAEMTTREITEELLARGLVTKAENPDANVHASLANRKDRFVRTGDGRTGKWMLKPKKN